MTNTSSQLSADYKWSWWRKFFTNFKPFLYIDYTSRARRQITRKNHGERELKILNQLIDPNRASIDVGANKGVYTYWLEKFSKKVYAYEANPELTQTFLQATGRNVEVRACGLSNVAGTLKFRVPIAGIKNSSKKPYLEHQGGTFRSISNRSFVEQDVKVFRLDELEHDPVGFIKIDVEGHEMEVIEGAKSLLEKDRPVLLVELVQNFHKRPLMDLVREVESLNYKPRVLLPAGFANPLEIDQKYFSDNPDYFINNFLFIPSEMKTPTASEA